MKKILLVLLMSVLLCGCSKNNVFKEKTDMIIINNLKDKDVKEKILMNSGDKKSINKMMNVFANSKNINEKKYEKVGSESNYVLDLSLDKDNLTIYLILDKKSDYSYMLYIKDGKENFKKINKKDTKILKDIIY